MSVSSPLGVTLATPSGVAPSAPSCVASFASLNVTSSALSGAMFITTPCATTPLVLTSVLLTPDEKRNYLFDVNSLLEIQIEDFNNNWWPLVSNIWTQWGSYKHVNGDIRKVFTCRFTKHRESSSREKENIPNEKRRLTKTRPSGLCHAKIEVF
ncbi:24692_t:CDS:1, partial [Gigaspora margarita]